MTEPPWFVCTTQGPLYEQTIPRGSLYGMPAAALRRRTPMAMSVLDGVRVMERGQWQGAQGWRDSTWGRRGGGEEGCKVGVAVVLHRFQAAVIGVLGVGSSGEGVWRWRCR